MSQTLAYAIAVVAFLAIYVVLRERHVRSSGERQPVQWKWIAAIISIAALAVLANALLG